MYITNEAGPTWNALGELVTCKASVEQSSGAYSLFEVVTPPQGGAPLHLHHREDEAFYVLEGELLVQEAEKQFHVKTGDFLLFPRGTLHTYKNIGSVSARLLVLVSPGGYEGFFQALSQVPLPESGPPDLVKVMTIARRFGVEVVGPPLAG